MLLCTLEVFLPTEFIEFALGLSAILTAIVALVVPWFSVQIMIWLALSGALIWLIQRWVRRQRSSKLDATEARTLTAIPAGETGRVLYEGNSWQARCD
ncbi:MAG: NfeD family protein, partial [Cyanobacteria bacterium P01_H01_bin.121]